MGAYELSKQDIAQTIVREPQHFGALSGLGLVETHIGNYDAALKAYEKAASIHPFLEGYDDMVGTIKKTGKRHTSLEQSTSFMPSAVLFIFSIFKT